jgi:formylglycine-generating enzyme required for sulfatase activity
MRWDARWLVLLHSLGCSSDLPPLGQVLLHVDTDAPVPLGPEENSDPSDPPPLFDRLRFDVYGGRTVSRDFAVTRGQFLHEGVSIGVLSAPTESLLVRVRLYRRDFGEQGEPPGRTVLESWVSVPAPPSDGLVDYHVFLSAEDVGQPRGTLDEPIAAAQGKPPLSRAGGWARARRVACDDEPRSAGEIREVCVPGGAYWMGHTRVPGERDRRDTPAPRLVEMSPFFIDATEVTVGAFRRWFIQRHGSSPRTGDPALWTGGVGPANPSLPTYWCSLSSDEDARREDLPLNCISFARAREYCQTRDPRRTGSDLPTEAQLEYAASALEGRLHVWGNDEPSCADAVYARSGVAASDDVFPGDCRSSATATVRAGPEVPGTGLRDRIFDRPVELVDLAGNLAELVRDDWNAQREPCWLPALLTDPLCSVHSVDGVPRRVIRGGSWGSEPHELRAAYRASAPDVFKWGTNLETNLGPFIGFRCARPARRPAVEET